MAHFTGHGQQRRQRRHCPRIPPCGMCPAGACENRDVEIVSPARLATLNFRYAPAGLSEKQKDELNFRISREIIASGFAGIFTTELNGKKVLRICAIHPDTTQADIRQIIRRLNDYYYEQRSKIQPSAMISLHPDPGQIHGIFSSPTSQAPALPVVLPFLSG